MFRHTISHWNHHALAMQTSARVVKIFSILSAFIYAAWLTCSDVGLSLVDDDWLSIPALAVGGSAFLMGTVRLVRAIWTR
jgi:hypothetical protein